MRLPDYPNVKNAHIVPRTYLANWAEDDRIATRLKGDPEVRIRRISKVGTRRRFYRRHRPDGTPIDDIEWSLAHGESAATPILRAFDDRWPLVQQDRGTLAELFAVQLVRGPRWAAWHKNFTREMVERWRLEQRGKASDDPTRLTEEALSELETQLAGSTSRFMQMLSIGRKIASAIGSMHWTLVEFASPVIATSDHPISMWPADAASRAPCATPPGAGIFEALEFRLPISPRHLILMTWSDKRDSVDARIRGARHHASNANAFTVAEADREWFYLPGTKPPVGTGTFVPLSRELLEGYDVQAAAHSQRRAAVSNYIQPLIGKDDRSDEFPIFSIDQD